MITAKEAYERTLTTHKTGVEKQLDDIGKEISNAIQHGRFLTWLESVYPDNKEYLEQLGYSFLESNHQFQGVLISWEKLC